jgi:hypothetical protein
VPDIREFNELKDVELSTENCTSGAALPSSRPTATETETLTPTESDIPALPQSRSPTSTSVESKIPVRRPHFADCCGINNMVTFLLQPAVGASSLVLAQLAVRELSIGGSQDICRFNASDDITANNIGFLDYQNSGAAPFRMPHGARGHQSLGSTKGGVWPVSS